MQPGDDAGDGRATWVRQVPVAIVLAAVVYLLWAIWDHDALMQWMERARALPFFVAMALLPAIGVPSTPLFLLAGATFGIEVALIGAGFAIAANLVLCYWIGRGGLRRRLVRVLERAGYALPDFDVAVADQSTRRTARFAVLVKLAPGIPGFIKHYGLAAARVPFWLYFTLGMLTTGAYGALLIVVGESLFAHRLGPGAVAVVALAALGLVLWRWSRRQRPALGQPAHAG